MDRLVDVHGLGLRSGACQRVADIDLVVEPGTICGLVGPNGAGKTSLLRLLAGLLAPTSGEGRVLGHDISHRLPGFAHGLGYLPQATSVQPELTVGEFLHFRAALYDVPKHGRAVERVVAAAGLSHLVARRLATLSGGWVRRTELAATLLHRPLLLLLDEPTSGLDQDARRSIWDVIADEAARGAGAIVNTHDLAEAERCDRIVLLVEGRMRVSGAPKALLARVGATNLAEAWSALVRSQ